jgi:hypothetical protein
MSKKAFVVTVQQDSGEGEGLVITELGVFGSDVSAKTNAQTHIDEYAKENPDEDKFELQEDAEDSPFLFQAMNGDVTFMVLIAARDIQE